MFSGSIIDNSWSINDTSRVIRIIIVSDAPSCGVILTSIKVGVIYDHNIFLIQATVYSSAALITVVKSFVVPAPGLIST